jgi:hypothetical protein
MISLKKNIILILVVLLSLSHFCVGQELVHSDTYLDSIKKELHIAWPKNRTINLVFHGHSASG